MATKTREPFRPGIKPERPEVETFQVHLAGDIAKRAHAAKRRSGLTAAGFARACIEYALANMETEETE